jgi:hypothetical protein
MPQDESTPPQRRALSPEEVGARVSAILEAAERDARAVIDAAHRAAAASAEELTLERVAARLDALAARVAVLESAPGAAVIVEASPAVEAPPAAQAPPAVEPETSGEPRTFVESAAAARVRAIELALAGYPRVAIARELAAAMPPDLVDSLLDEVLAP